MTDRFSYRVEETQVGVSELHVWVNGGKAGTLKIPRERSNSLLRLVVACDDTGTITHDGGRIDVLYCRLEVLGGHTHLELRVGATVVRDDVSLGRLVLRNEEQDALERICRACDFVKKVEEV